ncbi:phosphatase PAP2 family protein [Paraburkholderia sp. IMGN_8]|uniref:phosphatase PAP2 family protein n=1 Tax=Paraburkholderia sp. IMGN_8 TaxID=3136564 RepID=UPI003101718A
MTDTVRALAANALAGFVATLVLLLGAACGAWWLALRRRRRVAADGLPSPPKIAVYLGLSGAVVVSAAAVFATLAWQMSSGRLAQFDQAFTDGIRQSVPLGVAHVFALVTHFGDSVTLAALCVSIATALVLSGSRCLALWWVLAIAGNGTLNRTLKHVFERVRPMQDPTLALADGWSFPSGHTSGSLVAYGMLAYVLVRALPRAWHLPALLAATTVAFTTACSRVFIQVHFASDVLAGIASGTAWLVVCICGCELSCFGRARQR